MFYESQSKRGKEKRQALKGKEIIYKNPKKKKKRNWNLYDNVRS